MTILAHKLEATAHVEDRSALGPGTPGDPIEARLVRAAVLAGTLSDVEGDRGRSPLELVGEVSATPRKLFDDVVSEDDEVEGDVVDVELVVVEGSVRGFVYLPAVNT